MTLRTNIYRKKERLKRQLTRLLWGDCAVLLYHRVAATDFDPQQLCVDPGIFYDQLSRLKKDHHFLEIDEFCDHLQRKKRFPGKCALITFDDGYADNYHNALPVLRALQLQAVFYVATANIGTGRQFWWDEVDHLFRRKKDADLPPLLLRKLGCTDVQDVYQFVLQLCKRATSVEQRDEVMAELRNSLVAGAPYDEHCRSMSVEELQAMAASPQAVIGAHTVNHLSLGHIPALQQRLEIEGSKQRLEAITGKKIRHLAFPYGDAEHFNEDTLKICSELGLTSAAANLYAMATPKSDVFRFPRFIVRNDRPDVLLRKMTEVRA